MWDCCCESVKKANSSPGSGCMLAHCMGLGKTLQVIEIPLSPRCFLTQHSFRTIVRCSLFPALSFQCVHLQVVTFFHTVLLSDNLKFRTALVVCPLNTVLNWVCEFRKWQRNLESNRVKVCTAVCLQAERFIHKHDTNLVGQVQHLVTAKHLPERLSALQNWYREGGVMIMGYDLYRILSLGLKSKDEASRKALQTVLVDPGSIAQERYHLIHLWSWLSFHICLFRSRLCGV